MSFQVPAAEMHPQSVTHCWAKHCPLVQSSVSKPSVPLHWNSYVTDSEYSTLAEQ